MPKVSAERPLVAHARRAGTRRDRALERRGPVVPASLALAAAWSWRVLVIGGLGYFVIRWLGSILIVTAPILLGLLLAALLRRPALFLRRFLPRWLAALAVLLGALLVLGAIGWFVAVQVQSQAGALVAQAQSVLEHIRGSTSGLPGIGGSWSSLIDRLQSWVKSHSSSLVSGALTAGQVLLALLTGLLLTLFLTLFFLMDGERIWSWLVRLLPARARPGANGAGHRAFSVLSGWITGTTIIALIHAVVIGGALWLLGTPLVPALAVIVFIGSYIPLVGAFVCGGFAVLVTLVSGGLVPALILLGVLLVENLLEGHVYQPLIMGRSVRLHPVAILLALAVGGVLGGIFGAIAAIPVTAAVHAAVKYLTGIEDIHGNPVGDEDRGEPVEPPEALVARRPSRRAAA